MEVVRVIKQEGSETNEILNIILDFVQKNQVNIFEESDTSDEKK